MSRIGVRPAPRRVVVPRDFDRWREIARALLRAEVAPDDVVWQDEAFGQPDLFGSAGDGEEEPAPVPDARADEMRRVPRAFVSTARIVAAHADAERYPLLYRVLWRLTHGEPHLLDVSVDADVLALHVRERAVRRAAHKTKAFVRFRRVEDAEGERFVAWLDPEHDVLPLIGDFFTRRFPSMRWAILTPQRTAVWDGQTLVFAAGAPRAAAPADDELDALWRTYYAGIFNPARVKVRAMKREMPMRWWGDLPEARLIPTLLHDAPARVAAMHARAAAEGAALAQGERPRRGKRRRDGWTEPGGAEELGGRFPDRGARLAPSGGDALPAPASGREPCPPTPGADRLEDRP